MRATDDIDLLIARDLANQRRVKQALEILPDKAVRDLATTTWRNGWSCA